MADSPPKAPTQFHAVLRFRKSPFLECPRELRDIIYNYVLIEPDKYSKRHSAFCPYRTDGCEQTETPPFCHFKAENKHACQCSKRQCLGLLLACRQIYDEAAPIFWSQNTHHFLTVELFIRDIACLREVTKQHVHRISITEVEAHRNRLSYYMPPKTRQMVWEGIHSCKNLRYLEIGLELIEFAEHNYLKIEETLPHLKAVTLVRLQSYHLTSRPTYGAIALDKEKAIVVKLAYDIPVNLRRLDMDIGARTPFTLLSREMDLRVSMQILGRARTAYSVYEVPDTHIRPELNDQNNKITLQFNSMNRITKEVTVYGLRQSPETRRKLARERICEAARRKALGLPTYQEEHTALQVKQRKLEMKEQTLRDAKRDREIQEYQEQRYQAKVKAEEEAKQSKTKANQRVRLQRKIRKADKIKQEERKRVPKKD